MLTEDKVLWGVSMVLATIKLDNRITRLRTAVLREARKSSWTSEEIEQVLQAARTTIREAQPVVLRTLRHRHAERSKGRR